MIVYNTTYITSTPEKNTPVSLQLNKDSSKDSLEYKYGIPLKITSSVIDDVTMQLTDALDASHSYEYYYAGDTLTLVEGDDVSIFQNGNGKSFYSSNFKGIYIPGYLIDGKIYDTKIGEKVSSLSDYSEFHLDKDLNTQVSSGQLESFTADVGGNKLYYKAVNIYEKDAPLSECYIGSEQVRDSSGEVSIVWDNKGQPVEGCECELGTTGYMEAKAFDTNIFSASENRIVFKTKVNQRIYAFSVGNNPYGNMVIPKSYDSEMVFTMEDDTLSQFSFEVPDYLYGGLQNNISSEALATMSEEDISNAVDLRDSVIARFIVAFDEAGVDVDIEPDTGVIRMNNEILFDTGKYDVKQEGSVYINEVLGVISSVVLSEDVYDYIEEVEIGGHCDIQGNYDDNYVLSVKRAEAVKESFLNSKAGFNSTQTEQLEKLLVTEGYSFSNPIYDDNGNPDNAKSRRVEVKIYINTGTGH